jgi:hypothetical protein
VGNDSRAADSPQLSGFRNVHNSLTKLSVAFLCLPQCSLVVEILKFTTENTEYPRGAATEKKSLSVKSPKITLLAESRRLMADRLVSSCAKISNFYLSIVA